MLIPAAHSPFHCHWQQLSGVCGALAGAGQEHWQLKADVGIMLEHEPCLGAALLHVCLQFCRAAETEEAVPVPSMGPSQAALHWHGRGASGWASMRQKVSVSVTHRDHEM